MRTLAQALRAGHPDDPLRRAFAPLGSWPTVDRLADFEAAKGQRSGEFDLDGGALAQIGTRFHDTAGTLTPAVAASLAAIGSGTKCVRVSHQPNFAAYLKLLSLFATADAVADRFELPSVYVINDCDAIANERFVRCLLPDVTRAKGHQYLSLPVNRQPHDSVAFRAPAPPLSWLVGIAERLEENFRSELRLIGIDPPDDALSVATVVEDIEYSLSVAQNLAEFTAVLLSRTVNLRLELPTPFLPGHLLWREVGADALGGMLSRWPEVLAAQESVARRLSAMPELEFNWDWLLDSELAPAWGLCACDRRVRLHFAKDSALVGHCAGCKSDMELAADEYSAQVAMGRLLPRVGLLDLTENAASAFDSGVSYMSSGTHSLIYGLVGQELGSPPLPQIFLDARGRFGSPIERLLASDWRPKSAMGLAPGAEIVTEGRATSLYYLTRVGCGALLDALSSWVTKRCFSENVIV